MRDQYPLDRKELRVWVLSEVVVRTTLGAPERATAMSKLWFASWLAAALAVTIVLAVTAAPELAYGVPLFGLALCVGKARVQIDTKRSRGIQQISNK